MAEYCISCCSTADLTKEYFDKRGIRYVCFHYELGGTDYLDDLGQTMPPAELYRRMLAGEDVKTSQVSIGEYADFFRKIFDEGKDILHIAFSSGLSGTFNSCRIAAQELMEEYPERKIRVVDSLAASLGQGLLVYLAQRRKEEGADFDSVAQWTEEHKKNIVHLFTVDDLNHLYRGGRVSRTTAILGGMLNIKPILHVDDEGKLIPIGKVRGRKKSLLELVTLMDTKIGSYAKSCDTIFISHGDCREEAEFLAAKVKEKYHITTELINDVGAVIGAHSGPGTMALFFVGDVR